MNLRIINIVKYNRWLYNVYYYMAMFLIKVLRQCVKTDEKLIVFASFGGRKFDDSPRAIYERMVEDPRFEGFDLVWAFIDPDKFEIGRGTKIRIDTIRYFSTLLKARVWVTNSTMTRGLHFTGKHTFVLNTWHGTPIKRMGQDIKEGNLAFKTKRRKKARSLKVTPSTSVIRLAQGQFDVDVFSNAFRVSPSSFRITGLPRNDFLMEEGSQAKLELYKRKIQCPQNKKVILYAPTFREYEKDSSGAPMFSMPLDLNLWRRELGSEYVLLIRAHYEVARRLNLKDDDFVHDVSSYESLTDLMLASDILVSDYSSIMFDYSILGRPIICYCYDYERYNETRGLYFDPREELSCEGINSEQDLIDVIKHLDYQHSSDVAITFRDKYVEAFGNATEQSLDIIYTAIAK